MAKTHVQYKGYTLTAHTLTTPSGRVYELAHIADNHKGKRARMWYRGRRMYVYRAVVCVVMGVDRLPSYLDVHHVDANRHNCTPCNLVLLGKEHHRHAHGLLNAATTDMLNGNDTRASKATYFDYIRTHAATVC